MGYFNLINLKGWKPVTTWLNCLDSCWHHWRFGQRHKLFIYNETMSTTNTLLKLFDSPWGAVQFITNWVFYRATSLVHALNKIFWSMLFQNGSESTSKIPYVIKMGWSALQLLNNWLCFLKLTDSFMCFEGLPVPPKVWCQNGTLRKEWFEIPDRFHSLSAELNNSLLKFLEFILQSSMHFQLQNSMSSKHMWL